MAKGKGKKGKKQQEEEVEDPNALTEVDKTFYELQITDLNRKLARLRELTAGLEEKNVELEHKYAQLDEDRADVIAYLKKQLTEKQNEATELQERLIALQEAKDSEEMILQVKIQDLEEEYRIMKEQLTSEIKLLTGKLNALEEFRVQRDDLMKKYLDQEKAMEEQEIRHKRDLYKAEKMYIMSKDTIKKDMEKRIIELAKDFRSANEIRIAATTHRAIRENIAINNEMDKLQDIIERITQENEDLKFKNRNLKQNCDLYTTERNIALGKSKIHCGVIDELRKKFRKLHRDVENFKEEVKEAREKQKDLQLSKQEIINLKHKIRILEQNLHATLCETCAAKKLLKIAENNAEYIKGILFEAVDAIEQSLKVTLQETDESEIFSKRETLLFYLLKLINEGHQKSIRCESTDTIETVKAAYIRGDLGFVPKVETQTEGKFSVVKVHMDTQVGKSLEDLQQGLVIEKLEVISEITDAGRYTKSTFDLVEEIISYEEEGTVEEEKSEDLVTSLSEASSIKSKDDSEAIEKMMSKLEQLEAEIEGEETDKLQEEISEKEDEITSEHEDVA